MLDFVCAASSWLRFLGRFQEEREELPYGEFLGEFFAFLREERGLADATIRGYEHFLKFFLSWMERKHIQMTAVSPTAISTYFTSAVAGRWKRVTVSHHVQALRTSFRYVAQRGWCAKWIAESIDAPTLYTYENLR